MKIHPEAYRMWLKFNRIDYDLEDMSQDAALAECRKRHPRWGIIDGLRKWYGGRVFRGPHLSLDTGLSPEWRELVYALPAFGSGPEESAIRNERRDLLWRLVDELPDRHRLALRLQYEDDLSGGKIASVISKSVPRVRQLRGEALTRLRAKSARASLGAK